MNNSQISPEKITKPFQLLAAWLTGLVIIDGSFLYTATQLTADGWLSAILVISAIANIPIFLVCIFLLQTKYRTQMQEDSYYSKYLENQYSDKPVPSNSIGMEESAKIIATEIISTLEPLLKAKDQIGKTDAVEKILVESQLDQVTKKFGGLRTISELYLSLNTWIVLVNKWKDDTTFKIEIDNLAREKLIKIEDDNVESCILTSLGTEVAKRAQVEGLLFAQKSKEFWKNQHKKLNVK